MWLLFVLPFKVTNERDQFVKEQALNQALLKITTSLNAN